jgi:peptide/nickel transport system permease protein
MIRFLSRRLAYMALTLLLVSLVSFVIIQAAPGDYAEIFAAQKAATGAIITLADIEAMRIELGLDQPWFIQYGRWLAGALHGDFGYSWAWRRPVGEVIAERMPLTLTIAFATLIFMYAVSIPVGIYSAVRRYSFGDYAFSIAGYLGLAIPNFLLALVLLYVSQQYFHQSVGGLFSPGYENAAWSWA